LSDKEIRRATVIQKLMDGIGGRCQQPRPPDNLTLLYYSNWVIILHNRDPLLSGFHTLFRFNLLHL